MPFYDTLEDWQTRLAEIVEEKGLMVGRPGFSIAGMSTDEKGNYERLVQLQAEAEQKIQILGGGTDGTRNVEVISTDGSW